MVLLENPYIIAVVAALTIVNYLGRRELRPGRAAFAMFMVYGLVLCIVGTFGRPLHTPFWIAPILGLIVTPFLYVIWAAVQSSDNS